MLDVDYVHLLGKIGTLCFCIGVCVASLVWLWCFIKFLEKD